MKYFAALLIVFLSVLAWYKKEQLQVSPHESYHAALLRENLDVSALQWANEAEASLRDPLTIALPYVERRVLEINHLQPVTLAFEREVDQIIQVEIFPSMDTRAEVFVDIYWLKPGHSSPVYLDSMAPGKKKITLFAQVSGRYLVRIQPSYSATGLIDIAVTSPYRYGFPVDTESQNAVHSFFGVARDGGKRRHEGIDIFAPRGTPVIAAEAGRVARVGETPRGGKHVWIQGDDRSFYYAHLDSLAVAAGDQVARGDVLGAVGNTGNAVTTNPHLHFGIYKRRQGAVDPLPLVGQQKTVASPAMPDEDLPPRWLSIGADKVNLRAGPSLQSTAQNALVRGELVRIEAVAGGWLRVTAGSGKGGFIARRLTEIPVESNLELAEKHRVVSSPEVGAPVFGTFASKQQLPAYGRFGDFILVRMPGGRYGWATAVGVELGANGIN